MEKIGYYPLWKKLYIYPLWKKLYIYPLWKKSIRKFIKNKISIKKNLNK
jgi:hypothetical protein